MDYQRLYELIQKANLNIETDDQIARLESALQQALNEFRVQQNGANVHRTANILQKIQGMLTRIEISSVHFFKMMGRLNNDYTSLFNTLTTAATNGIINEKDCCVIQEQLDAIKSTCNEISKMCQTGKNCSGTCRFKREDA